MGKQRMESFSDGVIAVAITLLALNLPTDPSGSGTLAHRLGTHWPDFAAFAVSFITIGIIWINHHAALRRLSTVDHATLVINLLLLMSVCVLPFSTALMASYLRSSSGERVAAAIYGGSFLVMAVCFFSLQFHMLVVRPQLLERHITADARWMIMRRNAAGLVPYVVATALAAVSPYLTLAIAGAIALYYATPATRPDAAAAAPSEDQEEEAVT